MCLSNFSIAPSNHMVPTSDRNQQLKHECLSADDLLVKLQSLLGTRAMLETLIPTLLDDQKLV